MNRDIQEEASKHSDVRVIFTDAAQNSEKQIHDVEKLMKQGIDLLIISPNEAKPLTPIVQEVYRKIPVIVLDRDIESSGYTMFIGADNRLIGRGAGEFVSQLLGARGGNVVEIEGLLGSTPAKDRSDGFREAIAAHGNIRIVGTVTADWLRDKAEDLMREQLRKWPDVDVVFAHNDPMALGAYKAASALGRQGIRFVGIDGLSGPGGGIQLVNRKVLQATFIYPTGGKEAVQYAFRILNREPNLPKRITLDSIKVTADNVSDYLGK
ncbi:substrate-binding domain-containing protein [Gordoniibacillus kamchatkensis]|uniref:substrate-binding domain-containing protein n=1 Tax=Gordoniibacillus kamchatkensis TaxID=1590651 RepID=UPI000697BE9A|nr:substrate-binding domain-containing protein [Paenibacillus sp. VKM B-2647]